MNVKFILTRELGRLAKWLRIFGYDAVYFKLSNFSSLIITACQENRIIVTKNSRIGLHTAVRIINIKSEVLREQLEQIFKELKSKPDKALMFSRCIICNEELEEVGKREVKEKVPEYVYKTKNKFVSCPKCSRIYWQGTHWGNVKETIAKI